MVHANPTRRNVLRAGAGIVGLSALAGCTSSTDGEATPNESPTTEPTETTTTAAESTDTTTTGGSYTVAIEPVGEVTFESVPETWVANNGSWADMGVALGLEPPEGVWLPDRYHTSYYDAIDGVSVEEDEIRQLWGDGGVGKEQFYAMDADVHVMDPNFLQNRGNWSRSDVDEIAENVAPFFGNCIYAQHYPWHEGYRYYTLYEGFEKLAQVFQRTDRFEAFEAVHDDFESNLAPVVPGPAERPSVAVLWGVGDQPVEFYPYVVGGGTGFKHLRDLGVRDALAGTDIQDFHGSRASIDLETVLEVDPPVLLLRGYESKTAGEFEDTVVSFLREHETASALTAVENGDVYRAGGLYQGPITNMVLTERLAADLYGADGELFDRERVAEIVNWGTSSGQ